MGADFCIEALEEAMDLFGRPAIFNSVQGSPVHKPVCDATVCRPICGHRFFGHRSDTKRPPAAQCPEADLIVLINVRDWLRGHTTTFTELKCGGCLDTNRRLADLRGQCL
jgi:hypothetical protein